MSEALLSVRDLTVSVTKNGKRSILAESISLELKRGELLPIEGRSGSGKSTFFKILVRLHAGDSGSVYLEGKPVHQLAPPLLRSRMIYLHQRPMMKDITVQENLLTPFSFALHRSKTPTIETLSEELSNIGLDPEELLSQQALDLSGGQLQRVALVRALLLNPKVLLLDEPTSGLDPESVSQFITRVKKWVKEGDRGVLWIAHDRQVINRLGCDPLIFSKTGFQQEGCNSD